MITQTIELKMLTNEATSIIEILPEQRKITKDNFLNSKLFQEISEDLDKLEEEAQKKEEVTKQEQLEKIQEEQAKSVSFLNQDRNGKIYRDLYIFPNK